MKILNHFIIGSPKESFGHWRLEKRNDSLTRLLNGKILMIGQTISHYPAKKKRDAKRRHKVLEKLGEGGMSENHPRTLFVPLLRIPLVCGIPESGMSGCDFQDPAERSESGRRTP